MSYFFFFFSCFQIRSENTVDKIIKSTEPEFMPGVVLKIESKKPVESRQQLKVHSTTPIPAVTAL